MSDDDTSLLLDHIAELTGRLARAEFALGADGAITADAFPDAIATVVAERDRLRAVVAEYQRTYHALDHALDDDQAEAVEPQMREWQAAQAALLETPARNPVQLDPDVARQVAESRARQLDRAVDEIEELAAERDRLRAVVEQFQTTHAELDRATYAKESAIPAWTAFRAALDALLNVPTADTKEGT